MTVHKRPFRIIYDTLSLTNTTIIFCGLQTLLLLIEYFTSFSMYKIKVPCFYCALSVHLTYCIPINYKLHLSNSMAAAENQPVFHRILTNCVPNEPALYRLPSLNVLNKIALYSLLTFHLINVAVL